jgi:hypothetical protein
MDRKYSNTSVFWYFAGVAGVFAGGIAIDGVLGVALCLLGGGMIGHALAEAI